MNRASEIIVYLTEAKDSEILIIAPMAPPVDRTPRGLRVALHQILDASDVSDTLAALHSRSHSTVDLTTSESGTFSFGLKDVGRFRVNFMTQRGSKVVSIIRVPVRMPDIGTICSNSELIAALLNIVKNGNGKGLCILGPNRLRNSALAYGLLQELNHSERRVIYCLERTLSCLMHHDSSIVIQSELGIDVSSMREGVDEALLFSPDIMYIGDIRDAEETATALHAMERGVMTLFSTTAVDTKVLAHRWQALPADVLSGLRQLIAGVVHVAPNDDGTLQLTYSEGFPST